MAAILSSVLSEIESLLETKYAPARIVFRTGNKFLEFKDNPPRVVWIPTRDEFGVGAPNGHRPRALRTRSAGLDAHIFGENFETTEALVHAVIWACHTIAHGSYEIVSGVWETPSWLERGELCVLSLRFQIPVTDEPIPTVLITAVAFDTTTSVAGDGQLDAGET